MTAVWEIRILLYGRFAIYNKVVTIATAKCS